MAGVGKHCRSLEATRPATQGQYTSRANPGEALSQSPTLGHGEQCQVAGLQSLVASNNLLIQRAGRPPAGDVERIENSPLSRVELDLARSRVHGSHGVGGGRDPDVREHGLVGLEHSGGDALVEPCPVRGLFVNVTGAKGIQGNAHSSAAQASPPTEV